MTKNEFLSELAFELKKTNIADIEDIISEYEQHFAYKTADGFSEEEIAAKLGTPSVLASQFESGGGGKRYGAPKPVTMAGLYIADFFTGVFFILLTAWEIVFAAFSVSCAAVAVCLFTGIGPRTVIPFMPFPSGLLFGFALVALFVLSAVGCVLFRFVSPPAHTRLRTLPAEYKAAASGSAVLPPCRCIRSFPGKPTGFSVTPRCSQLHCSRFFSYSDNSINDFRRRNRVLACLEMVRLYAIRLIEAF